MMTLALFLFALFIGGCSNAVSTDKEVIGPYSEISSDADSLQGMIRIKAKGATGFLGTNNVAAKASERPQMKSLFDYDFSIAKHETTCSEFNKLMELQVTCEKNNLPATNITYYDAVLFANAKSKASHMDSAYTYTAATFDKERHCIGLDGLTFHPEANAYRLPTEAEWMLVAMQGWNPENGWSADNSEFTAHEVCTQPTNNVGVCDMAGNVMEWVGGWLGNFNDTTVTDFMGAPDGGGIGERIIKGGSFMNQSAATYVYSRGDVYMVSSGTKADYVGFRLAWGSIANPTWVDRTGNALESRIVPLATPANIRAKTGSYKSKLFFRNDLSGNLAFIDYSNTTLTVVEIKDSLDVYHPDVSPNGNWVAFCTGLEGISGKSTVYVRSVSDLTSSAVKLNVESAAIPRWLVTENGDTAIVYVTDAGNNKNETEFVSKSTWQVTFANGKFGEPQKLFDGAYHGGVDKKLAVTGARLLRARVANSTGSLTNNARDTIWYNKEQACNASLSKDGSKRTAFLDFGGKTGQDFVGESYDTHERLLIADSTGKLIQSIGAPAGYTFDHTEWAGKGIVATTANSNGAHTKIVYISTADSSIIELAEGEELWHPCLWTKASNTPESTIWDKDSTGAYMASVDVLDALLAKKLPLFWKYHDSLELIGLGNSHMWAGFNPLESKYSALNMAFLPCDMHCIHYMFVNYVAKHAKNLKYVTVSLDLDLWYNADESFDISYTLGDAPGFPYDRNHEFWPDGVDTTFVNMVLEKAPAATFEIEKNMGQNFSLDNNGWVDAQTGQVEILGDSTWSDNFFTFQGNLIKLADLISVANNLGITVVGIAFPISPAYKKTGAYGRHGMRRSHAKKIIEEIKSYESIYSNFIFMNENDMGNHDYDNSMSLDYDHLNNYGAVKLTHRLDSLLETVK